VSKVWIMGAAARLLVAVALLAGGVCLFPHSPARAAEAAKRPPGGARDLSAVWWTRSYNPRLTPVDGGPIPFTPAGEELYRKNVAALRAGTLEDHARVWCSPDGVPRIWAQPYPFRIVQDGRHTVLIHERNGTFRTVQMDTPVPPEADWLPFFMGSSYGHWEGDTLVIEAVGFKDSTFLDDTGVPHSDQLRLTERLRKAGRDRLDVTVTITDPVMFARPWDVRFSFARRDDVQHFDFWVCGEPHRDISQVQGAPR
jgi:hypothetical protein